MLKIGESENDVENFSGDSKTIPVHPNRSIDTSSIQFPNHLPFLFMEMRASSGENKEGDRFKEPGLECFVSG